VRALRAALWSCLHSGVAALRATPVLLCLALGLLLGDALAEPGVTVSSLPLAAALAGAAVLLVVPDAAWRRVGVTFLAFIFGTLAAQRVYRPSFPSDHIARAATHTRVDIEAVLAADPAPRGERTRLRLRAEQVDEGKGWRPTQGIVLLTVQRVERRWLAGDRLRATVTLRRPRNFGNPGEFDYVAYLARQGVYVTGFADDDAGFSRLGPAARGIGAWFESWRHGLGALIHRTLPEQQAGILSALVIGTAAALPADLRAAFSRAGVSHVLSVSGLHVGLVAAIAYGLLRWLLARSRWLLLTTNVPKVAAALSIVPVLLYAGIAGSNVATLRSVLMIVVFGAAVVVDRERHLLVSLAAAAIVLLIMSPGSSLDISFQLSFVAVLGLVLAMERLWPWLRRWEEAHLLRLRGWRGRVWRPLIVYGAVSLSALAATTPLTAYHFNQVSFIAVLANALVVPLLGSAAVALGLLAALLYLVSGTLAWVCVSIAGPVVQLGLWLVQFFAAWPYAAVRVVTPTTFELLLVYAALWTLVRLAGSPRIAVLAVLGVMALADGTWWYADRYHRHDLRVTFLSVGQGDAAVVEFPGHQVMMIDAGGLGGKTFDVGERVVAPFLWSRKIARVDYLVLSHPDRDHYGGLAYLARQFAPREFWSNGATANSLRFAQLERSLHDAGVQQFVLRRGDVRRVGGVDMRVLAPPAQRLRLPSNDESLVLSLARGRIQVLFSGDIERAGEDDLVASGDGQLASAVLKVPHHGSHTSSSPRFLDAVAPRFAVVSAGFENRYGFPSPEVLQRYGMRHCTLARTDLDGAVSVRIHPDGRIDLHRFRDPSDGAQTDIGVDSPGGQG
jgi:competence protein ComEC